MQGTVFGGYTKYLSGYLDHNVRDEVKLERNQGKNEGRSGFLHPPGNSEGKGSVFEIVHP